MRLTITAEVTARWGHRVDGLIHSHAWTVGATVEGPADASIIIPADELEAILLRKVQPWTGHYLTHRGPRAVEGLRHAAVGMGPAAHRGGDRCWTVGCPTWGRMSKAWWRCCSGGGHLSQRHARCDSYGAQATPTPWTAYDGSACRRWRASALAVRRVRRHRTCRPHGDGPHLRRARGARRPLLVEPAGDVPLRHRHRAGAPPDAGPVRHRNQAAGPQRRAGRCTPCRSIRAPATVGRRVDHAGWSTALSSWEDVPSPRHARPGADRPIACG